MIIKGHGRDLVRLQLRGVDPQRVGPLDGGADPPLGHDLKHPGLGQPGDVPVDAAGRHVGQLSRELLDRQGPLSEERLDDAQPHRVQQQVRTSHNERLTQTPHY